MSVRATFSAGAPLACIALLVLLTGCTAVTSPSPRITNSAPVAVSPLVPAAPESLDVAAAQTESERLVAQLVSTIPGAQVRNNDSHSQEVVKTIAPGGHYWGVITTLSLTASTKAAPVARALAKSLTAAGWIQRDSTDTSTNFLSALASSGDRKTAWFVVVGADLSVATQPVVTVQLASPDLP